MVLLTLSDDQVAPFLGGKPVVTTSSLRFIFPHERSRLTTTYPIFRRMPPCNVWATSIPEKFTTIAEITSLSLLHSNLTILPESLGMFFHLFFLCPSSSSIRILFLALFTNLVELDLSHNPLGDSSVPLLVSMIKASHQDPAVNLVSLPQFHPHLACSSSFRSLNDLKLTPVGVFQVIQALVFNFGQGNLVLQSLE